MVKKLRTLVSLVMVAAVLSACGMLNAFLPDVKEEGGVLGLGAAGQSVALSPDLGPAGLIAAPAADGAETVFSGPLVLGPASIDPIEGAPGWVRIANIVEGIVMDSTLEVVYSGEVSGVGDLPEGTETFTLTELVISGHLVIDGETYVLPTVRGEGQVVFGDPGDFDYRVLDDASSVFYTTADDLIAMSVSLNSGPTAGLMNAISQVFKEGGTVSAELQIEATLAEPGLPAREIVLTLKSLGATISF